ncbi:hypothetical protein OG539_03090 [Actinacidiphila glaucinigra]|uniref:hypothetical protein n=1 Tax=Actinacidiphila glaucinigra TaxID=235986 RepID=UPI002DDB37D0|nr:hypothetical protein [Actinacidiphila glaucinigra]WSD64603.1 hypothetical protein OIE69_39775 [Actinacidiphila glaucinigra]
MSEARTVDYDVTRFDVPLPGTFEEAVRRYESLVPDYRETEVQDVIRSGGTWESALALAASNAPHGFMIFWKNAGTALMTLAGDATPFVMYLMGNYAIAERMFRHDPSAMMHAPLRTEIYRGADGPRFVIDKPSSHFRSYGSEEITRVGLELDHKVARLLALMEAPVPAGLG